MKASISIVRIWIHLGLIPSADVSLYIWALDYLYSIREIAQITNSSESNVKTRIHRARAILLKSFDT